MDKSIIVAVDRSTWPPPPQLPAYPASFPTQVAVETINIPALLLLIGYVTTPAHGAGISINSYWAWVRYFSALSNDPDLRLAPLFWELDSHQKTILSDDFGMGVPLYWLSSRLNLGPICDGRYFIERVAAQVGAVAIKTSKRGPSKSPDFVAKDASGTWHVIECKGTQSGSDYRDRQFGDLGPPPKGGVAQKRTITFPANHPGQKLVCGLNIDVENGRDRTSLRIIDPAADGWPVSDSELIYADDAAVRATVARSLRLAGFGLASDAVAAPSGATPASREARGRRTEARRQRTIEEKTQRARAELEDRGDRTAFSVSGTKYIGRRVELDLAAPLLIDQKVIRSVRIRQGVGEDVLSELVHRPVVEGALKEANLHWPEAIGQTQIGPDGLTARLQVGHLFFSDIKLVP